MEYWPDGVRPDLLTDEGRGRKAQGSEEGGGVRYTEWIPLDRLWQIEFAKRRLNRDSGPLGYYIWKIYDDNGTLQDTLPFDEKPMFGNIVDPAHKYDP